MARGVRRRHLPASKWGRRRIVLSGPTLPPSISMSGAQSCRRQEACGQVDSRSAPDHFPTGPTTTEAVNSSGTQTGQLHRHQNHTPPKTANTRGSRPSSTAGRRTAVPGVDGERAAAAPLTGAALVLGRVPGWRGAGAHPGCRTSHADPSAVGAPMTRCQGLLLDLLRRVENALAPGLVGPGGAEAAARGDLLCGPLDRAAGLRRAGA